MAETFPAAASYDHCTGSGRRRKYADARNCDAGTSRCAVLDELPEFGREKLDLLRQPVEDKKVQIIRARYACTYPSDFYLLVR